MKRFAPVVAALLSFLPPAGLAQDLPESSPTALMHHAKGVEAYVAMRYAEAVGHFRQAHQSDPTSYLSLFMAGLAAGNAGQGAVADSFNALLLPHKDKLSPYYRYRLEAQMAGRAGDPDGYLEGNRRAAAVGPGTKAWYNVGQAASPRGMPREALAALRTLDPDKEPMRGWLSYIQVYTAATHQTGEFEDELRIAQRGRAAFPDNFPTLQVEGEALAALGRIDDAEKLLAPLRTTRPRAGLTPGEVMVNVAQEFGAHGNAAAGKRWLENALQWYSALDPDAARETNNRAGRAYTLYSLGRYREAAPVYDSLAAEFPNGLAWKAWGGFLAALTGDKARAAEVSRRIEAGEIAFNAVNRGIWRGLIAAALNDRDGAIARFRESGSHQKWMHRDPVLMKVFQGDARWAGYLAPAG